MWIGGWTESAREVVFIYCAKSQYTIQTCSINNSQVESLPLSLSLSPSLPPFFPLPLFMQTSKACHTLTHLRQNVHYLTPPN